MVLLSFVGEAFIPKITEASPSTNAIQKARFQAWLNCIWKSVYERGRSWKLSQVCLCCIYFFLQVYEIIFTNAVSKCYSLLQVAFCEIIAVVVQPSEMWVGVQWAFLCYCAKVLRSWPVTSPTVTVLGPSSEKAANKCRVVPNCGVASFLERTNRGREETTKPISTFDLRRNLNFGFHKKMASAVTCCAAQLYIFDFYFATELEWFLSVT